MNAFAHFLILNTFIRDLSRRRNNLKKYVDKFFCGVYNTTKISKTKAKTSLMFTGIIGVFVFFYF